MNALDNGLRTVHYPGSGNYLVAPGGQKICRYDDMYVHFWDGRNKHEISLPRDYFNALLDTAPHLTATPLSERR